MLMNNWKRQKVGFSWLPKQLPASQEPDPCTWTDRLSAGTTSSSYHILVVESSQHTESVWWAYRKTDRPWKDIQPSYWISS
jgi:hypothetical protein